MRAKKLSLKMSCTNDGRGTMTNTFWCVLPVCWVSVDEMAIVTDELRSNLLEQKNGATFSGVIWLSQDWIGWTKQSSSQVLQGLIHWLSTGTLKGLFYAEELILRRTDGKYNDCSDSIRAVRRRPLPYTFSGVCTSWITMVRSFLHNE